MKIKVGFIVMMSGIGIILYSLPFQDYFMLAFGVFNILIGYYLFQIESHTPFKAFLTARKKRVNLMEMERKDGNIEYEVPEVASGSAISDKYGIFQINEDGIKTELISRVKIMHCLEGIGRNVSAMHIRIIKALKEIYGAKSWHDINNLATHWMVCTNPDCPGHGRDEKTGEITQQFEGVFLVEKKKQIDEKTGEIISEKIEVKCPHCEKETGKAIDPPLVIKAHENVEAGYIDPYFKENQNPLMVQANIEDIVMNRMEKEKGDAARMAIKFVSFGIMIFLILLGVYILIQNLPALTSGASGAGGFIPNIVG